MQSYLRIATGRDSEVLFSEALLAELSHSPQGRQAMGKSGLTGDPRSIAPKANQPEASAAKISDIGILDIEEVAGKEREPGTQTCELNCGT